MAEQSTAEKLSSGKYNAPIWLLIWFTIKTIIKVVCALALLAVVGYFVVAITAVRYIPIYDHDAILAQNVRTDQIAAGTPVVFDSAVVDEGKSKADSLMGKLELATVPPESISVGVIEAGTNGKMLFNHKNQVSIGDKITGLRLKTMPQWDKQYLINQYVIKCVYGGCKTGKSYLLASNSVVGMPAKKEDISRIKQAYSPMHEHDIAEYKKEEVDEK